MTKKYGLLIIILCFFISYAQTLFAAGGITHMLIAQESIPLLSDPALRSIILTHMNDYLVGSNYPDTGYVQGANYGEDSHWEPFVTAFIEHLRAQSPHPEQTNPQLVAFLLGIATHVMADQPWHSIFIWEMTAKDFNGDHATAHQYADTGLDLIVLVDHNQWLVRPAMWWVPIPDLLDVYHRMGKDQYTANEIIWGNSVYSWAGIGERAIALPSYASLRQKMPWSVNNYYTDPNAGVLVIEQQVASYVENVWQRIEGQAVSSNLQQLLPARSTSVTRPILNRAAALLKQNNIKPKVIYRADGSVEIQPIELDPKLATSLSPDAWIPS